MEALCRVTEDALEAAIKIVKPGVPLRRIGATIHEIADKHKFGVVDKFVGHGVGKSSIPGQRYGTTETTIRERSKPE